MVTPHRVPARLPHPVPAGLSELRTRRPVDEAASLLSDFLVPAADAQILQVQSLQPFGLSSRESRLYVTLLESGPVGAGAASELSGLRRATGYRTLARLLARGLVRGDGQWPQRFRAEPAQVLFDRMAVFLHDEIEFRRWSAGMYPLTNGTENPLAREGRTEHRSTLEEKRMGFPPGVPARMVGWGSGSGSVPLSVLRKAQRGIDAFVRPTRIPGAVRNALATALVDAARRGVAVRLVLDYAIADHRFLHRLAGESRSRSSNVDVRHFTPLAGHLYVVDGRTALRFPTLGGLSRGAEVGLASRDLEFVRAQVARFESVWNDATSTLESQGSTRSFNWLEPKGIRESAPWMPPAMEARTPNGGSVADRRLSPL
jgi:hypothetical protein